MDSFYYYVLYTFYTLSMKKLPSKDLGRHHCVDEDFYNWN